MKTIKTNIKLTTFEGETLKEKGEKEITIGYLISSVLGGSTTDHHRCWQLGQAFATKKEVDLKAEDVVFIKGKLEQVKHLGSMTVGQVIDLLESK